MACNAADAGNIAQFGDVLRRILQVVFCQHQDRCRATIESQHEFALDSALIRFVGGGVHDEHGVDVRRNRMLLGTNCIRRCASNERRASGQHMVDALEIFFECNPVADCNIGTNISDAYDASLIIRCTHLDRAPTAIKSTYSTN